MSAEVDDLATPVAGRLVGRDEEIDQVLGLLLADDCPDLLTLCGAAGIGKTSTAIEVADRLETSGRATAFVRLESAVSTSDLLLAVAAAVSLPAGEEGTLLDRLTDVGGEERWVVLDNCEHLRGRPHPVAVLRQACPGFRLLATSIRPLRVTGERALDLPPLPLPPPDASAEEMHASPAVQLYLQRAAESSASFDPAQTRLADVAAVCRQVDGLPLGIELLAARVTTMPPATAHHYLQAHPAIGLEQPRRAPAVSTRHQSLHAALEWTHALVPDDASTLLRRMAVFSGPVGLEQLGVLHTWDGDETDGQRDSELLDLVADLVDVRLVEPRTVHHEPTFALLPLVRDFALAQLDAHGEREMAEERRAEACLALVRARKRDLDLGSDSDAMVELGARETDLRQVLDRLVAADDLARGWTWPAGSPRWSSGAGTTASSPRHCSGCWPRMPVSTARLRATHCSTRSCPRRSWSRRCSGWRRSASSPSGPPTWTRSAPCSATRPDGPAR
ncbi:ATP-binding protein [Nocardioides sambongensis]|uniref:ATP-binding protein n=1 Tax=Nocardioides sambongensis TaxID=2589074 RepID=UPI0015E8312D|nr:AAA family ATPase [Nocardioides sambongensis]